jgi:NB-ARC domain
MSNFFSIVPFWTLPAAAGVILSVLVVSFIIRAIQGGGVTFWPRRPGSRPVDPPTEPGSVEAARQYATNPHASKPAQFRPEGPWRQHAIVDHDKLFGVAQLVDDVATAVSSQSANWIVSLFGDGGIGKTTAAYEAAVRCAQQHSFSRIAWASATNVSSKPSSAGDPTGAIYWSELLRSIAGQLDVDLGLSRSLWERDIARALAAMADSDRVLTVIDNLESSDDAADLVERLQELGLVRPHKLVVTTRWSVQKHSNPVTEFLVPSLRQADAIALVRHLGRADRELQAAPPEALAPIFTITEGNPFLIKIVIKHYLVTHRALELTLAELMDLRGNGSPHGSIGEQVREHLYLRSLSQLSQQFGDDVSRQFMSSFCAKDRGDSFGYSELRAISGIPDPDMFRDVLESACRIALVRSTDLNRAYSIHSLLHEFTCRRA